MAKAIKKQALGRGLSALLQDPKKSTQTAVSTSSNFQAGTIVALEVDLIEVNPFQPRTQFKEETIRELAVSIQELGVIQPITVRKTEAQMSQRVAKKRSTIANYLRLLKLDPLVQTGMRDGFIGMGHGRALVNINSHTDQIAIYKEIISNKLSVRGTEKLVRDYNTPKSVKKTKQIELPDYVKNGVKKISSYFGHKIDVKMEKKEAGKILIPFHSKEDYDRILKLFKSDK